MPRYYKRMKPSENKAVTPGETKAPPKTPPKAPPKDPKKDGKDEKEGGGK